jgi:hypothetical protein
MFFEESEDFLPTVHRLFLPIGGAIIVEKAVARSVIAMKLVVLPLLVEFRLMLVNLLR